jgi:hypothetical protein
MIIRQAQIKSILIDFPFSLELIDVKSNSRKVVRQGPESSNAC